VKEEREDDGFDVFMKTGRRWRARQQLLVVDSAKQLRVPAPLSGARAAAASGEQAACLTANGANEQPEPQSSSLLFSRFSTTT